MRARHVVALAALGFLVTFGWTGCDTGPMQQTGRKIDRVTDQDTRSGGGTLEKAGMNIDEAVKERMTER